MTPSRHPARRTAGLVAVALIGLVLAAGVTYAASHLVSQPIGLRGQPGDLGVELAPSSAISVTTTVTVRTVVKTVPAVPPATTPTTPTTTGDDSSGRDSSGSSGDHGGVDDHGGSGHDD